MKVWYCKIGEVPGDQLPDGADQVMRTAVEEAYFELAGNNEFIFSGWGAQLTEAERAVVEDREPDMATIMREHLRVVFTDDELAELLPAIEGRLRWGGGRERGLDEARLEAGRSAYEKLKAAR